MSSKTAIPDVRDFEAIVASALARAAKRRPRAALIDPADIDAVRAFARAAQEGLIEPFIIGEELKIEKSLTDFGVNLDNLQLIDTPDVVEAVKAAGRMAGDGELDMIVQGRIRVADLLSILFDPELKFRFSGRTVSHVAVIKPERHPQLILLTDGGVVVKPDFTTKLQLIQNMIKVAGCIGIDHPRIAVLAAVEVVYPQMEATMDGAVLAKMSERGQIKGAYVDGPLSFDVAVDPVAAESKGITNSEVAGRCDGMLAPSIEVANGVYNAMTLHGRADVGGIIIGGRVPLAVNSRADSEQARFNSIALASLAS
jgi:phosphate butyryltransferase